jgi:hypothetical protein
VYRLDELERFLLRLTHRLCAASLTVSTCAAPETLRAVLLCCCAAVLLYCRCGIAAAVLPLPCCRCRAAAAVLPLPCCRCRAAAAVAVLPLHVLPFDGLRKLLPRRFFHRASEMAASVASPIAFLETVLAIVLGNCCIHRFPMPAGPFTARRAASGAARQHRGALTLGRFGETISSSTIVQMGGAGHRCYAKR